jgi:hypothetical protein
VIVIDYYEINSQSDYDAIAFSLLHVLEGAKTGPYYDHNDIQTIGVGANLLVDANMRAVMALLGFTAAEIDDDTPTGYRQLLNNALSGTAGDDVALAQRLNAVVAAHGGPVRSTFTLTFDEMVSLFVAIKPEYEQKVDAWIPNIPLSYERIALFSVGFNQRDDNPRLDKCTNRNAQQLRP